MGISGSFEGLNLTLMELAEIPDDIIDKILNAGAEVVKTAHKRKLRELGLIDTGVLEGSVTAHSKVDRKSGQRYYLVYPAGKHRTPKNAEQRKVPTNGAVGFVLEYGAPRQGIKAYQWMSQANEECEDKVLAAEEQVYNDWLKSRNLI